MLFEKEVLLLLASSLTALDRIILPSRCTNPYVGLCGQRLLSVLEGHGGSHTPPKSQHSKLWSVKHVTALSGRPITHTSLSLSYSVMQSRPGFGRCSSQPCPVLPRVNPDQTGPNMLQALTAVPQPATAGLAAKLTTVASLKLDPVTEGRS